jgi:AraC-like DNA-binding protein
LDAVTCLDDHPRWSAPEVSSGHRMVMVRRGRFRRGSDGHVAVVDPTLAYLAVPGQEERFAHPAGGDECTALYLSPGLWRALAGDDTRPARSTVYVDARLELAHRRVLSAARAGDPAFELAEALLPLVSATLSQVATTPTPATGRRAPVSGRSAAIVEAAREAIATGHPAADGLVPLAELLTVSPYQLSRAFTRELGVSLTHYRNRVRVSNALDRLEQGEPSLATLATDLGFADQAHLTRTIRSHLGHTPKALRRLLTHPSPERGDTRT